MATRLIIPETEKPFLVWDTRPDVSPEDFHTWSKNMVEHISWARYVLGILANDTYRIEFFDLDRLYARVWAFERGEGFRYIEPESGLAKSIPMPIIVALPESQRPPYE